MIHTQTNKGNVDDPFLPKTSRADLTYVPQVKDLKDVVYFGDLSSEDGRKSLLKILDNHYPQIA